MAALPSVAALLERFQLGRSLSSLTTLHERGAGSSVLRVVTEWPSLDQALPDGAFVAGVSELASVQNLGGGASVAIATVAAALRADPDARVAWVDADCTLYAPALKAAGVDLSRLLVVRPPRAELRGVALKLALSLAFSVIVVDVHGAQSPEAKLADCTQVKVGQTRGKGMKDEVFVRRLALAAEEGNAAILLLTDSLAARATTWPVALRLELSRRPNSIALRVSKDRYGRIGTPRNVCFDDHPTLGVVDATRSAPSTNSASSGDPARLGTFAAVASGIPDLSKSRELPADAAVLPFRLNASRQQIA
jgi:hypothetical protein